MSAMPAKLLRFAVAAIAFGVVAIVSALPALAEPAPQQPAALSAPAQQFLAAVRTNFAKWDRDHDGVLTREEIELDMQNPRIVGDAAAALAALKLGSTRHNHLDETRTFTLADIDAMEREIAEGRKLAPNFVNFYVAGLKKLDEQPRDLFVEGIPRISAIRQDFTTDCYFLSAAGALAQVNPQALVRLIARNKDGSFTVSFPGQPPVRVAAPTDSEIAAYTISKDGIWLNVLQRAYAVLRIQHEPNQPTTREPLDSVGFRFGSTRVMELLTGHASRAILLPAQTHKPIDDHLIAQTRIEIQNAMRERREVTASSSHHAYAIVAYDAQHDLITVHNPYNRGGVERWIQGDKVQRTDEGFFVIPTAQLVANFYNVRFEENRRAGS
jgi:calpain family cysteine protease